MGHGGIAWCSTETIPVWRATYSTVLSCQTCWRLHMKQTPDFPFTETIKKTFAEGLVQVYISSSPGVKIGVNITPGLRDSAFPPLQNSLKMLLNSQTQHSWENLFVQNLWKVKNINKGIFQAMVFVFPFFFLIWGHHNNTFFIQQLKLL